MSQANVNSVQAIQDVKAALAVFVQQATGALEEVDLEIRRVLDWLLNDQPGHWQRQIRQAEDQVTQARLDLHRCRMSRGSKDYTPDCTEQKVALRRAEQRVDDAREKLRVVREWGRQLPTTIEEYEAQSQQLGLYLADDLSRAAAALEGMTRALDAYLSVAPATAQPSMAMAGEIVERNKDQERAKERAVQTEDEAQG